MSRIELSSDERRALVELMATDLLPRYLAGHADPPASWRQEWDTFETSCTALTRDEMTTLVLIAADAAMAPDRPRKEAGIFWLQKLGGFPQAADLAARELCRVADHWDRNVRSKVVDALRDLPVAGMATVPVVATALLAADCLDDAFMEGSAILGLQNLASISVETRGVVVGMLRRACQHESLQVRRMAISALGVFSSAWPAERESLVPVLQAALHDLEEQIRDSARDALERLTGRTDAAGPDPLKLP